MSYTKVITDGGYDLLRAAPGHRLVYSRAACGSGVAEDGQLKQMTDLTEYVMDLSITEMKPTETAATLRLQLDNRNAPREFQLQQIGIYAMLLDGNTVFMKERLLQVTEYDKPDIVRKIPHVSEYLVSTLMGDAETVEGIIDMAAYVSIRQFRERQPTAHIATIEHNLPYTPIGALFAVRYAAGIGGAGEHPAGGEGEEQIPCRLHPIDSDRVEVLTIPKYAGFPEVHQANDHEFALVYPDSDTSLYLTMR